MDDAKRGGDIDLLLELATPALNPAYLRAEVSQRKTPVLVRVAGRLQEKIKFFN